MTNGTFPGFQLQLAR